MIRSITGAIQYLTIVPVPSSSKPASPGSSAVWFPLVGAVIGVSGAIILSQLQVVLPFPIAALMVLAFWAAITGGLHEDGFADCADAMRSWRSRQKILEILKDSRIGAHGALAMLLFALIRWQGLSSIGTPLIPSLAAVHAIPRAAIVALAWLTLPTGSGSGFTLSQSLRTPGALFAILQGVLLALWCGGQLGSILLGGSAIIVILARRYFMARIGGFTGDCLGATEHILETFCLLVFACRPCIL
ncbi:MAG TPA: adenosylcobinamide-GDP ribazoletransferase [Bryobacteraceae bacterium]|nr:adenosylcobinamide-GDP ribazoletransferase [Bryobacteraceae bacterium]